MEFGHYNDCSVEVAASLVNSLPDSDGVDRLSTTEELRDLLVRHNISGIGAVGAEDVEAARALRHELRKVFTADSVEEAAQILNRLIREARALPQLTNHDGEEWHLHYEQPGSELGERITAETAIGLAAVLVEEGLTRFRVCASPTCEDVFVDASRNRSRRFCSAEQCGNRVHVAAHRARRRAEATS